MNETGRPQSGPPRPVFTVADAQDVLARIVAAREELAYEPAQAAAILADLEADLAALVEGVA